MGLGHIEVIVQGRKEVVFWLAAQGTAGKACGASRVRMTERTTAAPCQALAPFLNGYPSTHPWLPIPTPCHHPAVTLQVEVLLTSCQGGDTSRLGVHSKQVLKQRGDYL